MSQAPSTAYLRHSLGYLRRLALHAPDRVSNQLARAGSCAWPLFAVVAALIPVAGVFTLSKIFYIRDLTTVFWPRHRWLRASISAGQWPLWDPNVASGQAAVSDALHQLFLLPALIVRLLPPEIVGFNLWVALPFPITALGAYRFLVGHVSPPSALLGGIVFAVSGPVVCTGNFPNLSWATAFIPWMLLAVDRAASGEIWRGLGRVALVFALQLVSGEPVTATATAVLAVAYAAAGLPFDREASRSRASLLGRVLAGLGAGVLLAAVQVVPLAWAAARSARTGFDAANYWAIHPLSLIETIVPHLFGDYFAGFLISYPWLAPLNGDREPFYFSLYLGIGSVALALVGMGASANRRWAYFWLAAAAVGVIGALGDHTPLAPAVQQVIPPLRAFRFPPKYLLISVMATAALAAAGWEALAVPGRGRAPDSQRWRFCVAAGPLLACAVAAYVLGALTLVLPNVAARLFYELGRAVPLADPAAGALFLLREVPSQASRVLLLSVAALYLLAIAWRAGREAPLARTVLYGLVVGDLLISNAALNPTLPAGLFGEPAWVAATRTDPQPRVYVGGKLRGWVDVQDIDAPKRWILPADLSPIEGRAVILAELLMEPSGWGIREAISYDLPMLWPREYETMVTRFERAGRDQRLRYLARAGARYCVLPEATIPTLRPIMPLSRFDTLALYECATPAPRAYVVTEAVVERDLSRQIELMFDAGHDPSRTVLLEAEPPPAAGAGAGAVTSSARIVAESTMAVSIEAAVNRAGGYLVLLDSYDPFWYAEVDGQPARILRANALFRAVRLSPGSHVVRFTYRPLPFFIGLVVSIVTGIALAAAAGRSRGRHGRRGSSSEQAVETNAREAAGRSI